MEAKTHRRGAKAAVETTKKAKTPTIILSRTAEIHGRGSDPYKWVSRLTETERRHVRTGGLVLIRDTNPHPACSAFKKVVYRNGRYYHRNYYAV